ncbi:MAG: hypothetical protein CSB24_04120 [Deltaproteobacteria bacterium]|nr:MAG: hypothetical protein CSB24_04120 [Deltaproteobacteria bacterium]
MFVLRNFILSVADLIAIILQVYTWIVLGRVVISWVNADPYNPIVRFLCEATDPLLERIRRFLPISIGSIDFSPMILVAAIIFLQNFLVTSLKQFALGIG